MNVNLVIAPVGGITGVGRIHPLGTMTICMRFHLTDKTNLEPCANNSHEIKQASPSIQ